MNWDINGRTLSPENYREIKGSQVTVVPVTQVTGSLQIHKRKEVTYQWDSPFTRNFFKSSLTIWVIDTFRLSLCSNLSPSSTRCHVKVASGVPWDTPRDLQWESSTGCSTAPLSEKIREKVTNNLPSTGTSPSDWCPFYREVGFR